MKPLQLTNEHAIRFLEEETAKKHVTAEQYVEDLLLNAKRLHWDAENTTCSSYDIFKRPKD